VGQRYLIDTNVIIDFFNGKLTERAKELMFAVSPEISIITNIELFSYPRITNSELNLLNQFVEISKVHGLNIDMIDLVIQIRSKYSIKLPDAVIASTAIFNNLSLISRNIKDFKKINGLKIINPYAIEL
jgi:predicted nucleic acid-binding protein